MRAFSKPLAYVLAPWIGRRGVQVRGSTWADGIKKLFDGNVAGDGPTILTAWEQLDAYLKEMIAPTPARPHR